RRRADLRKRAPSILAAFLVESVALSLVGGAFGMGCALLTPLPSWSPEWWTGTAIPATRSLQPSWPISRREGQSTRSSQDLLDLKESQQNRGHRRLARWRRYQRWVVAPLYLSRSNYWSRR